MVSQVSFFGLNFLFFLFGLAVGSFINCLVYRLNHGLSPILGRSICPHCKHKLAWSDNIPLISFILLKGRCRYCHSPISWQYPLVELATGLLTVFLLHHISIDDVLIVYYLMVAYGLIAIFVSDLLYQTIPDEIIYPAIVASFLGALVIGDWSLFVWGVLAGLLFLILVVITRGKGMGVGDVKLAVLMGLFLGFPRIIVALYFAFLTGAFLGVILILTGKKRFREKIAFGPFLVGGTMVSFFWGEIIWRASSALLL